MGWGGGDKKEIRLARQLKKWCVKADFLARFPLNFVRNPPLFIRDEKGTSGLYCVRILTLDLNGKNLNCWPKITITGCQS
jgi:hypothetical protein